MSAVAGVMADEPPSRPDRLGMPRSSGGGGGGSGSSDSSSRAFRAPGVGPDGPGAATAAASRSSGSSIGSAAAMLLQRPLAAAPAGASALPLHVQQDMLLMKDKIAELQARVSARKAHVAALSSNGSSSSAAAPAASSGGYSPSFSAGAAAAAAATTAVAAAVAAPGVAVAADVPALAAASAAVARPAIMRSMDEATGVIGLGVVDKSLPAARLVQSATVTLVSSGAGVAVAAAGDTAGSSMERRSRWSSSVVTCPSLVEDTSPAGRLAALRARTAAAMAAREQLSVQAHEAKQALAALSHQRVMPAAGAAAGAAAAGSSSSSVDNRQRADRAQRAVAALSHWEVRAASAKQTLEALEQQAAAALAELEAHDASTKARQQQRQQQLFGGLKPPQFAVPGGGVSLPAGFGVSRVLGGLPEAVGQLQVPDPVVAAAAVAATGLAAMQAVHHYGGHLLQNVNL